MSLVCHRADFSFTPWAPFCLIPFFLPYILVLNTHKAHSFGQTRKKEEYGKITISLTPQGVLSINIYIGFRVKILDCVIGWNPRRRTYMYALLGFFPLALPKSLSETL